MAWIWPVVQVAMAAYGTYSTVNANVQAEKAEDKANEKAREQQDAAAKASTDLIASNESIAAGETPGQKAAAAKAEKAAAAAESNAQDTLKKKKRATILSGGQTNLTQGQSILGMSDVSQKNLLGA